MQISAYWPTNPRRDFAASSHFGTHDSAARGRIRGAIRVAFGRSAMPRKCGHSVPGSRLSEAGRITAARDTAGSGWRRHMPVSLAWAGVPPDYSAYEGELRWLGAPHESPESAESGPPHSQPTSMAAAPEQRYVTRARSASGTCTVPRSCRTRPTQSRSCVTRATVHSTSAPCTRMARTLSSWLPTAHAIGGCRSRRPERGSTTASCGADRSYHTDDRRPIPRDDRVQAFRPMGYARNGRVTRRPSSSLRTGLAY